MKLSEAMMLPTDIKFSPMVYLNPKAGCLLGQALNVSTGRTFATCGQIMEHWPWLNTVMPVPAILRRLIGQDAAPAEEIITDFAICLGQGSEGITREVVADWILSVEPSEPEPTPAEMPVKEHELCL